MQEIDLIVENGFIVTMDRERRLIESGSIAVDGSTILAVDKSAAIAETFVAKKIVDARDKLVLPGLIDGHNHPIHFLSKGMVDDMRFPERWRDRVWPYEAGLSATEARLASTGTFIEMIRHGTTCFADPGTFQPGAVAEAAGEVGIRGVISRMSWDVHDPTAPDEYNDDTDRALARGEEAIERWHGSFDDRVRAWFSLVRGAHVTDQLCRRVKARADELGVGIHGHLCSTKGERAMALETWGVTPVERYRKLGLLGFNLYLVHMGWIDEEDVETLGEHDVSVCHCPSASMFGGFGCIAHGRFPELVARQVRVVLGTDACAISRFLDMVRVMYLAACSHKDAKIDPTVIGAHKALEMVTVDAAKALLWDDGIGSIEGGKRADIIVVDTDGVEWQPNPFANAVANFIYSADGGSVCTVIIDGAVVMEDREIKTVDVGSFLSEAADVSRSIFKRMNIELRPPWPVI